MKDAARLLGYFVATLLLGALTAPWIYWLTHDRFAFLARYDFETFFHRALLVWALLLFWPLLRSLKIRSLGELGLEKNPRRWRDLGAGFGIAAVPLLGLGGLLISLGVYSLRGHFPIGEILSRTLSAVVVPFIEEPLFRGLILGALLRTTTPMLATFFSSALFSILHFLKAPEQTSPVVAWNSGLVSIGHAFSQFQEPLLVLAGFTTLFLLAWILADARLRTRSLWLPIGLHGGWIFASALFNKIARREFVALPWIGKSLLIGIAPLAVALLSWLLLHLWHVHARTRLSAGSSRLPLLP